MNMISLELYFTIPSGKEHSDQTEELLQKIPTPWFKSMMT